MTELAAELHKNNQASLRSMATAAAGTLLAIACLFYRSSLLPGVRNARVQAVEYLFIVFASVATIAFYRVFGNRLNLRRILGFPGLIFLCSVLLFGAVYKLGMYQFGGFDESVTAHAATYYAQGFKPNVDFPCSFPPFFMGGIRLGTLVLGLHWASFAIVAAAFAAFTSLWMFAILRRAAVPSHWALAITLCVEVSTMVLAPMWWFNNSTSVAAVLLLVSVVACLRQGTTLFPWISLAVSLGIVLTSKPNVETECLMVFALFATRSKGQWARTCIAGVGALVLAGLICFAAQTPLLAQLHSYAEVAKLRGSPLLMFPFWQFGKVDRSFQFALTFVTVLFFADQLIRSVKQKRRSWPILIVCVVAAATSLEMTFTNAEMKLTDLVVMVAAASCLCLRRWDRPAESGRSRQVLASLLLFFLVTSGFFALTHVRILLIGYRMFYEPLPTQEIRSGFFSRLEAGPRLLRVEQETARALTLYPSHGVFFGPRMEFSYAAFNLPVMANMPLIWDAGVTFGQDRVPTMISSFRKQDPDLLIFLKDDYTRMGAMADYIWNTPTYQRVDSFEDLTVYVRKRQTPGAVNGPQQPAVQLRP